MKLFDVYPLFDVNIVKGQGCRVWDDKGQAVQNMNIMFGIDEKAGLNLKASAF